MKITWLGQGGLLLETPEATVLIDPYLSDSVKEIQPHFWRRVPVKEELLKLQPDLIVLTHDHLDHTDPDTLKHYLSEDRGVCVLASQNAWKHVRSLFPAVRNNYVQFNRGTQWSQNGLCFQAVSAEHSDEHAIGVVIRGEGKCLYVTGDTLYHPRILQELPSHITCVFLPINGVGNNMNPRDAARFCREIGAPAVPMHCGLFDEKRLEDFPYENKIIPEFYKEIPLP